MKAFFSKQRFVISILTACLLYVPFAHGKFIKSIHSAPVIGKVSTLNGSEFIAIDFNKLKDTTYIPLSELTEELEIIRLDNSDDALVGKWMRTSISENYILTSNSKQIPYKLFDKNGKFITDIGSYGQGPNEYMNTYSEQLDEENNRIYILPWQAKKILVFDLKGAPLDPIPLSTDIPKGQFHVNTKEGTVTCTTLPFQDKPAVVWVQGLKGGKPLQFVPSGHLAVKPTFSNEVGMGRNTSAYDLMLMVIEPGARIDSLYHYNKETNKLLPVFTVNFPENMPPTWHGYSEIPNHFYGHISIPKKVSENVTVGTEHKQFIVDKKTQRGCFFQLYNDFLGDNTLTCGSNFYNGYFIQNSDPMDIKEKLEKMLQNKPDISKEKMGKVRDLINSIDENDNNILLKAKLKNYTPLR